MKKLIINFALSMVYMAIILGGSHYLTVPAIVLSMAAAITITALIMLVVTTYIIACDATYISASTASKARISNIVNFEIEAKIDFLDRDMKKLSELSATILGITITSIGYAYLHFFTILLT